MEALGWSTEGRRCSCPPPGPSSTGWPAPTPTCPRASPCSPRQRHKSANIRQDAVAGRPDDAGMTDTSSIIQRAADFVWHHGRLLDRRRLAHFLDASGQTADAVAAAVAAYRNP